MSTKNSNFPAQFYSEDGCLYKLVKREKKEVKKKKSTKKEDEFNEEFYRNLS